MTPRKNSVAPKQDPDGGVPNERRAATLKTAIRDRTLPETVIVSATWNKTAKCWDIEFTDEDPAST
ncbi:MAG: hypothetical protein IT458_20875 [Planctomycetes bacterium]|nr:hypothetical protein [Planctomycetota bacterium]